MNKKIKILILIISLAVIFVSCDFPPNQVESTSEPDTCEQTELSTQKTTETAINLETTVVETLETSLIIQTETYIFTESIIETYLPTDSILQTECITEETATTDIAPCNDHTDNDNNGKCDFCDSTVIIVIDLYAINDLHGKFDDTDSNEGVDELTAYLKNERNTNDHVVILSSGDMWQGSSESNLTKGMIVTDWMNHLDFVSMTLGNHEFDWGEEFIIKNDELAEFPFLAINIFDRETGSRVEYCEASTVIECGDVSIGIIGAIGDCYSSVSGDKSQDIYFITGEGLTSLIKAESERLRQSGVDYIILSTHEGREGYDIALSDGYVDLVFEGHTHQKYVNKDSGGIYHLQNGGDNKGISHVELTINFANMNSEVNNAEFVSIDSYASLEDDPIIDELLIKYEDIIGIADEVLGHNVRKRYSNEIKSLIAKLYYETGFALWGNEYDIVLGGGFISTRSPYDLPAGDLTYGDLQMVIPFDNQLVLCSIKGKDLLSKFLETTNKNYFIFCGEYGEEIRDQIDPEQTYYLITDKYSSTYAPNNLTEIAEYDPNVFARDLLAQYISLGGWAS